MKVLSLLLVRAQLERTDDQLQPVVPQCRVDTMTLVGDRTKTALSLGNSRHE